MKKFLFLLLAICTLLMASCKVADDKVITGDVKDNDDAVELDSTQNENDETDKTDDEKTDEIQDKTETGADPSANTIEEVMAKLCLIPGEGGEFEADANSFADAVATANKEKIAEYTQGKAEYYSFLDDVVINGYDIYPVYVPDEIVAEKDREGKYFTGSDMYLVDLDVKTGDGEYFKEGHNLYYIALGFDAAAGGLVRAFVPAESAEEHIYYYSVHSADKTQAIIKEFLSLYPNEIYGTELYEGKNYPEDFDFSPHVHLVTHLMARNGAYGAEPPYTLDEINEFLSALFYGNEGITPDGENWTLGIRYGVTEEDEAEGRIYGCSWGHGGTTVEHSVLDVKDDGDRKVYTVQLYADYSHFAKSKLIEITFENAENDIPNMVLVYVREDTGNNSAVVSV